MENEKNLAQPKPAEIVVADQQRPEVYGSFVEYANKELTAAVVIKTNCKLCNSKYRKEAEEMYCRNQNMVKVHRYLQDSGEDMSYPGVRNHLLHHFRKPELEERLKDYADDLHSWSKIRQETEEMHRSHIAILQRRIYNLEAQTDETSPESMRKTADTITKLIEQIGKEQERIANLKSDESPVKILFFKFQDMVKIKLENMTSAEARVALVDILDGFGQIVAEFENNA